MAQVKDSSGFTAQERHQVVLSNLEKNKKDTKVFHLRWCPGDLLDEKILKQTPIFWYMRFGWSRLEIETLFFEARVYIDPVFENSLDSVFGKNSTGPRWLPPEKQDEKKEKWNRKAYYKSQPWWQVNKLQDLHQSQQPPRDYNDKGWQNSKWNEQQSQNTPSINKNQANVKGKNDASKQGSNNNNNNKDNNKDNKDVKSANQELKRRSLLNKPLSSAEETIWQIISDYDGKDKPLDAKKFAENLQQHGINISPEIAQKLYEQLVEGGKMDFQQFSKMLKNLDQTKLDAGVDVPAITLDDLDTKFNSIMLMKRVLLAAANDIPFEVNEFAMNTNWKVNVGNAHLLLQKLVTRSVKWNDRQKAIEDISNKLGSDPTYNSFFEPENASQLLMGWMVQCLDERPSVQKAALDSLPSVFQQVNENSHPDVAMGHLDDVVDGLFGVLNNPRFDKNQDDAKKALNDVVDEVVKTRDADAVLYLAGLLGQKTDIGECSNPKAREAALDNLKRVMLDDNANALDPNKLPDDNAQNKEWLDMATSKRNGPSEDLMNQGKDDPNNNDSTLPKDIDEEDLLNNDQKGKKHKNQQTGIKEKKGQSTGNDEENNSGNGNDNKKKYDDIEYGSDDDNAEEHLDDEDAAFGGDSQNARTHSSHNDDIAPSKRAKGKENDLQIKFGKNKKEDASNKDNGDLNQGNGPSANDQNNPTNDNTGNGGSDANNGATDLNDPSNNPDDNANGNNGNEEPNKQRKKYNEEMSDGSDLDDDDTGKRGGTQRKSINGKQDFNGKFADDNVKRNSWGDDKTSNDKERTVIRDPVEQQKPVNKAPTQQNQDTLPKNSNPQQGTGDEEKLENPNQSQLEPSPLTSNEIGDEYRNIVNDAVSNALMDPNKNNQQKAAKFVDLLENITPGYSERLDPDAKNRFVNWKHGPSKKFNPKIAPKDKPLPSLNVGTKKLHEIDQNVEITIAPPTLPDI